MMISQLILLIAFGICVSICLYQFFQALFAGNVADPAKSRSGIGAGIFYAFTAAMSPYKKESARLHLPSYIAGIMFHLGTFLGFFWLSLHFFNIQPASWLKGSSLAVLIISSGCGAAIFAKRLIKPELRSLSHADDYFSNLIVTLFQILSALAIGYPEILPVLFILASFLFLYIPLGKLRHAVYFFTSRIHLGAFYGKRGVWSIKRRNG
ncbi:hypothetical protein JXJ21_21115 [candidate division KSB1 bacterium]|nr:hypothetical protein [candidate division KSB1 bacterium]